MSSFFITGTDTGVGKTLISAILTIALNASYWKPIQCGTQEGLTDREWVQKLTGFSDERFFPSAYFLKAPLSPDQAAKQEEMTVHVDGCIVPICSKKMIVEGAGGIYVPLNDRQLSLDLIKKLAFPVIIVARGTLGTINHTLLTIEGLRHHHIPIHGIVFTGQLNGDNQKAIEHWGQVRTLFHVPFFETINSENIRHFAKSLTASILHD